MKKVLGVLFVLSLITFGGYIAFLAFTPPDYYDGPAGNQYTGCNNALEFQKN